MYAIGLLLFFSDSNKVCENGTIYARTSCVEIKGRFTRCSKEGVELEKCLTYPKQAQTWNEAYTACRKLVGKWTLGKK